MQKQVFLGSTEQGESGGTENVEGENEGYEQPLGNKPDLSL